MIRLNVLTVYLICSSALYFVESSSKTFGSDYNLNHVQNLTEFFNSNPGIELQPLIRENRFDPILSKIQIVFRWGDRNYGNQNYFNSVNNKNGWAKYYIICLGDRLLATDSNSFEWHTIQNKFELKLWYPSEGTSAYILNFFEVIVDQVR